MIVLSAMDLVLLGVSLVAVCAAVTGWWIALRRPRALESEAVERAAAAAVVEMLADPVLVLDHGGRLLRANPAGTRFLQRLDQHSDQEPLAALLLGEPAGDSPPRMATGVRELVVDGRGMLVDLSVMELPGSDPDRGAHVVVVIGVEPLHRRSQELTRAYRDLVRDCDQVERRRADLAGLAARDALTGLSRRRELPRALQVMCDDSSADFALLVLDVDRLDLVNQVHGYPVGDLLLGAIGRALRDATRAGDVVVRFGGEEFVVLMRASGPEAVLSRAEDLRAACAAIRVGGEESPVEATVSVGAALSSDVERTPRALQRAADRALWTAKRGGRDRVVLYQRDDVAAPPGAGATPTRFGTGSRGRLC